MPAVKPDTTIKELQDFINDVYGKPNDLHFELSDMLKNIERFAMRALKGIRKHDKEKTRLNLVISISWFMSTLNRLHIDLEHELWSRFPYLCSYCASCPCLCKEKKIEVRREITADGSKRPAKLSDFQKMFREIYPPDRRNMEHAGVHLAEELGEFSEALMAYRGEHEEEQFKEVLLEAADIFSCFMGVFNSLDIELSAELSTMFAENCHECRKAPCECSFNHVIKYNS